MGRGAYVWDKGLGGLGGQFDVGNRGEERSPGNPQMLVRGIGLFIQKTKPLVGEVGKKMIDSLKRQSKRRALSKA